MKYTTVDEYIAQYDRQIASRLQEIRATICATDASIQEKIWYNVPHYYYKSTKNIPLIGYSVAKNHITIGFTKRLDDIHYTDIIHKNGYKTGIYTVQIQHTQAIPHSLLQDIIRCIMRINTDI